MYIPLAVSTQWQFQCLLPPTLVPTLVGKNKKNKKIKINLYIYTPQAVSTQWQFHAQKKATISDNLIKFIFSIV